MNTEMKKDIALPRRIAVATDFSVASGLAIAWAIAWANNCGANLYIVHVTEPGEYQGPIELRNAVKTEIREEIDRELACYVDRLRGIPHEFVGLEGKLGKTLSDFVKAKEIDLLITGSRGRRGVQHASLGSGAEAIFHAVTCQVMTIGIDSANYTRPADGIHRVLFPTDFSPDSLSALTYAVNLTNVQGARLFLLHVANPSEETEPGEIPPEQHHLKELECALAEAPSLKVEPTFICMKGYPTEAILTAVRDHAIDLLVLGIRDQKHLEPAGAKTSLSYEIIARAQCPVITMHRFRKEEAKRLHRQESKYLPHIAV